MKKKRKPRTKKNALICAENGKTYYYQKNYDKYCKEGTNKRKRYTGKGRLCPHNGLEYVNPANYAKYCVEGAKPKRKRYMK